MELELRHLRCLVALADAGDVQEAARALKVTERALLSQLGRIEQAVGRALFSRASGPLTPTARGREILDPARAALAELDELRREARRDREAVLRFAGPPSVVHPVAARFAAARPDVVLSLRAVEAPAAVDALRAGEADAVVTVRWPAGPWPFPDGGELRFREVDRTPLRVLLPDTHSRAGAPLVDLAALAGEPWCVRAEPGLVDSVIAECVRHGFEPDVRFSVDSDEALRDVVASGRAVALVADPAPDGAGAVARPYRNAARSGLVLAWCPADVPAEVAQDLVGAIEGWHASRTWAAPAAVAAGSPGSATRPLRIGSVTAGAVIPTVPRLRTVHGIHAEVVCGTQRDVLDAVRSGALDLAVCDDLAGRIAGPPDDWPCRTVGRDEPVLVALGAGHRLARRPVRPGDLADETWTVREDSGEAELVRALGDLGGFEPRIASAFTDPRRVAAAVASGRLVRLAEPGESEPGVVHRAVDHPAARRGLQLVWPPGGPGEALADRVAEELRLARTPYTAPYPQEWTERSGTGSAGPARG